jgi:DNA repair protein RadA/Sms
MVLAVLETRLKLKLAQQDVYASTVGGVKISESSADLAAALAVISAAMDRALPADLIALGEVGLAGDVRPCSGIEKRLAAAGRLGFRRAIIPYGIGKAPEGMFVVEAGDLRGVMQALKVLTVEEPARLAPAELRSA